MLMASWRCALCVNGQSKPDNTNTTVQSADDEVTTRRGGSAPASNNPQGLMDISTIDMYPLDLDSFNDTSHSITVDLLPTQALIMEMQLFRKQQIGNFQSLSEPLLVKVRECRRLMRL